jgi:hypothetical protein
MHYDFVDLAELAQQHQISETLNDSDASQIFLHQLMSTRPKSQYANAEHTKYFTLWQIGRLLNLSSAALLLVALLWSAANFWQGNIDAVQAKSANTQATRTLSEAQQLVVALPRTSTSPADLKSSVLAFRKLEQATPTPQLVLLPISQILDIYPNIQLDELSWQMSATEPVAPHTLADMAAQVITLKAHLDAFDNNYRLALDYLNQFQATLVNNGYQVTVLAKPFDVSPSGSIADQHESRENTFSVAYKVTWRPPL